jgi:hypothetical protein
VFRVSCALPRVLSAWVAPKASSRRLRPTSAQARHARVQRRARARLPGARDRAEARRGAREKGASDILPSRAEFGATERLSAQPPAPASARRQPVLSRRMPFHPVALFRRYPSVRNQLVFEGAQRRARLISPVLPRGRALESWRPAAALLPDRSPCGMLLADRGGGLLHWVTAPADG